MKSMRCFLGICLVFALAAGLLFASPAEATKQLVVGTASVTNTGDEASRTRDIPITLKGGFNDVNGLAFTLIYDRDVFEFLRLVQENKDLYDGDGYDPPDSVPSENTIENGLFFIANDRDDEGRVLVAGAAAKFLATGTGDLVPFKARFRVKEGMGSGTYSIGVQRTIIGPDTALNAGYNEATLIPVAVGLAPDADPGAAVSHPVQLVAGSITVAGGYAISGTVKYANTNNADGATVRLFRKVDGQFLLNAEDTVKGGAFSFSGRQAGEYRIVVRAANPGFQSRFETAPFNVSAAHTVPEIVLAALSERSGTVRVNGALLGAVRVQVWDGDTLVGTFPVDASGRFVTSALDPGKTYTVKAVYGNAVSDGIPKTDGVYDYDWALGVGSIAGMITGLANGQQAMVHVVSGTTLLERTVMLTGDGNPKSYTVGNLLPATDYVVSVTGDAIPVSYYDGVTDIDLATEVAVVAGQATDDIDFTFAVTAKEISGQVKENNAGVADVPVFAFNPNTFQMFVAYSGNDGAYSLKTGDGDFQVFAFKSNGKTFYYTLDPDTSSQLESDAADVTAPASDINIHLDEAVGKILGQVTLRREGGDPVPGIMVMSRGPKGNAVDVTDAAGNYTLSGLYEEEHKVTIYPNEPYAPQTKRVAASEAGTTLNFVINTGWVLSGTVTKSGSTDPVPGAWVYLINSDGLIHGVPVRTGPLGRYTIADIPGGIYTLKVEHPDFMPFSHVFANGIQVDTTKNVALIQGASIVGLITDEDGGAPIQGALVIATALNEGSRYAVSDNLGNYKLEGLTDGVTYFLVVNKAGYLRKVASAVAALAGTTADVALSKPVVVFQFAGTVVSGQSGGDGILGAVVVISSDLKKFSRATATGGTGAFSFAEVPGSGDYKIVVIPGGNKPVYVETDYNINANITDYEAVIPDNTISGKVALSDEAAGKSVQVYLLASDSGQYRADVNATDNGDGTYSFSFSGVSDAETYKIAAFSSGYTFGWFGPGATGLANATAVNAGEADRDFTLTKP